MSFCEADLTIVLGLSIDFSPKQGKSRHIPTLKFFLVWHFDLSGLAQTRSITKNV